MQPLCFITVDRVAGVEISDILINQRYPSEWRLHGLHGEQSGRCVLLDTDGQIYKDPLSYLFNEPQFAIRL